jgi:hypothetical protein
MCIVIYILIFYEDEKYAGVLRLHSQPLHSKFKLRHYRFSDGLDLCG